MIDSPAAGAISWEAPDDNHPARQAAQQSMSAVAGRQKEDWLSLFAADALVEDPVGPSALDPGGTGHWGRDGIERFWDDHFGAVSQFHFRITDSFANGTCCANVATITMTLGGGATMRVDCVIIYTVNDAGLITSLRAHWEPGRALATLAP
jgi:steroid Delta-isomerase